MGSSPGFGSVLYDSRPKPRSHPGAAPYSDSVSLRLRHRCLKLAAQHNSPAHSSIGTPSGIPVPKDRHSPPTACRHTVSGSISLPFRGSFHLSLTVLVRYRSPGVFSLGGWSPQIPTEFHVPRGTQERCRGSPRPFTYRALTVCGLPFQDSSVRTRIGHFPAGPQSGPTAPYNPRGATPAGYHAPRVWAVPVSLATTPGISVDFFSFGY
jgi:hypothetical protein